jgi:5-methylcytosine-specific restriction enzyme A
MPSKPKTFQMRPKPHRPDYRPSAHRRGYGSNWKRLRVMVLNAEPLCRWCRVFDNRNVPAEHVDHNVSLAAGGANDLANLIPLCHSCHSRKTVMCDGGLGRAKDTSPPQPENGGTNDPGRPDPASS